MLGFAPDDWSLVARVLAMLACVALLCGCSGSTDPPPPETVFIAGEKYVLEVAANDALRERGLMHRQEIPAGAGMLFIFPEPMIQSFWMGHCQTDIDVIYLDANGHVTAAHRMKAEAPQRPDETDADYRSRMPGYSSVLPAQFAIELPPGSLDRLHIRVDQRIDLDLARLKGLAR